MKITILILVAVSMGVLSGCSTEILPSPEQLCSSCLERIEARISKLENPNKVENKTSQTIVTKINTDEPECVGIMNYSDLDLKKYTECVMGSSELKKKGYSDAQGYCQCLEKYSKCDLDMSEVPQEYWKDFNPECAISIPAE